MVAFCWHWRAAESVASQGLHRHCGILIRAQGLAETQRWLTTQRGGGAASGRTTSDYVCTEVSLHLDWSKDKQRAFLQEIHSIPSSQESAERSHHGCPTHAGISRLFAHGESWEMSYFQRWLHPVFVSFFYPLVSGFLLVTLLTEQESSLPLIKGDGACLLLPLTTSPKSSDNFPAGLRRYSNDIVNLPQCVENFLTGGMKHGGCCMRQKSLNQCYYTFTQYMAQQCMCGL